MRHCRPDGQSWATAGARPRAAGRASPVQLLCTAIHQPGDRQRGLQVGRTRKSHTHMSNPPNYAIASASRNARRQFAATTDSTAVPLLAAADADVVQLNARSRGDAGAGGCKPKAPKPQPKFGRGQSRQQQQADQQRAASKQQQRRARRASQSDFYRPVTVDDVLVRLCGDDDDVDDGGDGQLATGVDADRDSFDGE